MKHLSILNQPSIGSYMIKQVPSATLFIQYFRTDTWSANYELLKLTAVYKAFWQAVVLDLFSISLETPMTKIQRLNALTSLMLFEDKQPDVLETNISLEL